MDAYDKAMLQLADEFFESIPELKPLREMVEEDIQISVLILFFGTVVVLVTKALAKIIQKSDKKMKTKAETLLISILSFLDKCLESGVLNGTLDDTPKSLLDPTRDQASVYFAENLYKAGEEYDLITKFAPTRLKDLIVLVEGYYGRPKARKQRTFKIIYDAVKIILSE